MEAVGMAKRKKKDHMSELENTEAQDQAPDTDLGDDVNDPNVSGLIHEPRVFELMYLEKAIVEAGLQRTLQTKVYNERITQLKSELSTILRQWEATQRKQMKRMEEAQLEIEDKHGIYLYEWGYDDVTGCLQKHPPDVLAQIHAQREMQRKKNAPEESDDVTGAKPDKDKPSAPVAEA